MPTTVDTERFKTMERVMSDFWSELERAAMGSSDDLTVPAFQKEATENPV